MKMKKNLFPATLSLVSLVLILASCSTTSAIPDGEQLYWGQKEITYTDYTPSPHAITTREEVDVALATAPTGAFMGSSTIRNPLPMGLWVWNAFSRSRGKFSKWMNKSFGTEPLLMSEVNPELRTTVARQTLIANGYFHGKVDYKELPMKNPKKERLAYSVEMGPLSVLDSVEYVGFPSQLDSLIHATASEALISKGSPFCSSTLEGERQRLARLFRENGYYFYNPSFATFKADTIASTDTVKIRLQLADSLDQRYLRQWRMGKTAITIKRHLTDQPDNFVERRSLRINYSGRHIPVRSRVILSELQLRPRQLYAESAYRQSLERLSAHDIFSMIDFSFTPADTTTDCRTLDMMVNCVLDKPYEISLEGNITGKTTNRFGPGAEATFTTKNLFRAGEKISLSLIGSYEWQTGGSGTKNNVSINSYEYGLNASVELPRLLLPVKKRHRWYSTPSTLLKLSNNVVNRGSFFNRHIMAAELTYSLQTSACSRHTISPLVLEYDYMNRSSEEFRQIMADNPYLYISMQDQLIPKIRYTYAYSSPKNLRSPISWETTISEAGNLFSMGYAVAGHSWSERDKKLLRNPYAQFLKVETDFTKKWRLAPRSDLVGHINAGVVYSFGNSDMAPYSEQLYVGGANSIRAFTVRSIGPGRYRASQQGLSYLDQTGDVKFVANLEYRPHIAGSLYGAVFLDAGNVWALKDDGIRGSEAVFRVKNLIRDMALATGVGIRYDLDFFVIRVDWGVGLHLPYDTGRSGFFNLASLKNSHSFHLAIGYPF